MILWGQFVALCSDGQMDELDTQQLIQTILALVEAPNWNETCHIVQRHPELMNNEADLLLQRLASLQNNELARQRVETNRIFLQRCREIGVETAFQELRDGSESVFKLYNNALTVPPQIYIHVKQAQEAQQHYRQSNDLTALNRSINAWRSALEHPDFANAPNEFQLSVLNNASLAFYNQYVTDRLILYQA